MRHECGVPICTSCGLYVTKKDPLNKDIKELGDTVHNIVECVFEYLASIPKNKREFIVEYIIEGIGEGTKADLHRMWKP